MDKRVNRIGFKISSEKKEKLKVISKIDIRSINDLIIIKLNELKGVK